MTAPRKPRAAKPTMTVAALQATVQHLTAKLAQFRRTGDFIDMSTRNPEWLAALLVRETTAGDISALPHEERQRYLDLATVAFNAMLEPEDA